MDENIGKIYGDFIVEEFLYRKQNGHKYYTVRCMKCGRTKESSIYVIPKRGNTHKSCGQFLKTKDKRFHVHWQSMRLRTTNKNVGNYKWYGGIGINSDVWEYFIDFYDDMYESFVKHVEEHGYDNTTLERIDHNGNYCKENCKWATWEEQHGNTSKNRWFEATSPEGIKYKSKNQREFAREHGLSDKQINACLTGRFKTHLGWTFKYL